MDEVMKRFLAFSSLYMQLWGVVSVCAQSAGELRIKPAIGVVVRGEEGGVYQLQTSSMPEDSDSWKLVEGLSPIKLEADQTERTIFLEAVGPVGILRSVRIEFENPHEVMVPAGHFVRGQKSGNADERPEKMVFVDSFNMDETEVTWKCWRTVQVWAEKNGYDFDLDADKQTQGNDHPVTGVSWYDAVKWSNARSEMSGLTPVYFTDFAHTTIYKEGRMSLRLAHVDWDGSGYRLPTEAEWERACRGSIDGQFYPWPSLGGSFKDHIVGADANYEGSGDAFDNGTTPVKYFQKDIHAGKLTNGEEAPEDEEAPEMDGMEMQPASDSENYLFPDRGNDFGLYDMAGNVYEWCWDRYSSAFYENDLSNRSNTQGPDSLEFSNRVLRGGSFLSSRVDLRCAARNRGKASLRSDQIGFRCVRNNN